MKYAQEIGKWPAVFTPNGAAPLVALAPMSGITDSTLRRIAMREGAGFVVSEMVASDDFVRGEEETRLRAEGHGIAPHIVQLAGCDARWLADAARLAEDNGADVIDINMGCPAKRVTGGWAGSALMRNLHHAEALIAATVAATALPVTVKMRLGWDSSSINAPELARRAVEAGACAITVHGRTRQQFYKGEADWATIRLVRQAVPHVPLIANGDVRCLADALACLDASGADAVMVGRAALGRPWLPGVLSRQLRGEPAALPSLDDRLAMTLEHYQGLIGLMGEAAGVRHARKHLAAALDDAAASGAGRACALKHGICTETASARVIDGLKAAFEPHSSNPQAGVAYAA